MYTYIYDTSCIVYIVGTSYTDIHAFMIFHVLCIYKERGESQGPPMKHGHLHLLYTITHAIAYHVD